MPTIAVYVPARVYRAHGSDPVRIREICKAALDEPVFVPIADSEPWPEPEPEVVKPSAAEKDWATGDPIAEEVEPDFVTQKMKP